MYLERTAAIEHLRLQESRKLTTGSQFDCQDRNFCLLRRIGWGFASVFWGLLRRHSVWFGHRALAFLNHYFMVCCLWPEAIHCTRGPPDGDGIDASGRSYAEMEAWVAGRFEAGIGSDFC